MRDADLNILMISDDRHRSGLVRQALAQSGIECGMRRVDPADGACAYARRTGVYRKTAPPDLILFDLVHADSDKLRLLKQIAIGNKRAASPVVVLTSLATERTLDATGIGGSEATMFAPTELSCFLQKMRQHRRRRFMRALTVMYEFGPLMVRLPHSFSSPTLEAMSA